MGRNGKGLKTSNRRLIRFGTVAPLLVGAFLVLSGSLAANSWREDKQRRDLDKETERLAEAIRLESPSAPRVDKLKEAQRRLEKASDLFPPDLTKSVALQSIMAMASRSDVEVVGIQEKAAARRVVGGHVYYAWPFSVKVEGSLQPILALVTSLEGMEAGPLALQKLSLGRARTAGYAATLDVAFYTRSRTESPPSPTPQKPQKPAKANDKPSQK